MIKEDKILDIADNLRSIAFCIDNKIGVQDVPSSEIIDSINQMKKSVLNDISAMRESDLLKSVGSDRLKDIIKGRLSSRVSLLYTADIIKNKVRAEGENVKVSNNVLKYLRNDI